MAVNQSQVDHIITAASEDDPEVKLQNLEREVDLIKTSIKRLLMDIRERMNEMENPFTIVSSGTPGAGAGSVSADIGEAKKSALEAREAALDARESQMEAEQAKIETDAKKETPPAKPAKTEPVPPPVTAPVSPPGDVEKRMLDEQMFAALNPRSGLFPKIVLRSRPRQVKNSGSRRCTNSSSGPTRR